MLAKTDPLKSNGPDGQRELFERLTRDCGGFSLADVLGAAQNLIVNALRQSYAKRSLAKDRLDVIAASMKGTLLDQHYDATGRRRSAFPFHQIIYPKTFINKDKFS